MKSSPPEKESPSEEGPFVLMKDMKEIEASKGWNILQRIRFHTISYDAFTGNYEELNRVLALYHNPEFALPLWEVRNRPKLDLFQREIVRMLHNYVASAKSLVEHTRKFVRQHYSGTEFERKYDSKVNETFHNPFCAFVIDLRDFILHNALPQTSASVHFEKDKPFEFAIKLNGDGLRKWDGWNADAQKYLGTIGSEIELDDLVHRYASLVREFYKWFGQQLQDFHSLEFEELSLLQTKFKELYGEF